MNAFKDFKIFFSLCIVVAGIQSLPAQESHYLIKINAQHPVNLPSSHRLMPHVSVDHPAKDIVRVPVYAISQSELKELQENGDLIYFEQDAIGYATAEPPNDPLFSRQWYLYNDGSFVFSGLVAKAGADLGILQAWNVTTGDPDIIIAILDTGVNPDHPELMDRLWTNPDEIADNNKDDDGNGFIDDVHGWNFVADEASIADDSGHGTAIAGAIAAETNNATGYSGINLQSKVMTCKVLEADQSGLYSNWTKGIYYAVDNGADIINLSVAGETDLKTLEEAVQYAFKKGVLIVCSMGNNNREQVNYPAGYGETVAVGSTNANDTRSAAFSDFGGHIDLVAPGNAIFGLDRFANSYNTIWSGTSMSAAMVTGVASLLLSYDAGLSPNQIKGLLYSTAADQVGLPAEDTPGWDKFYGFGRVNAYAALAALQQGEDVDPFKLMLFPNPVSDELRIAMYVPDLSPLEVSLYDVMGKRIQAYSYQTLTPDFTASLDVTTLRPAVYIVSVRQGSRVFNSRVVVY